MLKATRNVHVPSRERGISTADAHVPTREHRTSTEDVHVSSRDARVPTADLHVPTRGHHTLTGDVHVPTREAHVPTAREHIPSHGKHPRTRRMGKFFPSARVRGRGGRLSSHGQEIWTVPARIPGRNMRIRGVRKRVPTRKMHTASGRVGKSFPGAPAKGAGSHLSADECCRFPLASSGCFERTSPVSGVRHG